MPLPAGQMRERVTLERRAAGVDALGQPSGAWTPLATVWARVRGMRGREFFAAGQTQEVAPVFFDIRHRTDLDGTVRVVWRGQPHDVTSVADVDGRREWLELSAVRGVGDGR